MVKTTYLESKSCCLWSCCSSTADSKSSLILYPPESKKLQIKSSICLGAYIVAACSPSVRGRSVAPAQPSHSTLNSALRRMRRGSLQRRLWHSRIPIPSKPRPQKSCNCSVCISFERAGLVFRRIAILHRFGIVFWLTRRAVDCERLADYMIFASIYITIHNDTYG